MGWKDWLAGAAFLLLFAFAVTTFVVVLHHEKHPHPGISQTREESLQSLCYGNLGNGGC